MTIIKKVVKKFTYKGITIEFTLVKLDDGKWYKVIKNINGDFILKENIGNDKERNY